MPPRARHCLALVPLVWLVVCTAIVPAAGCRGQPSFEELYESGAAALRNGDTRAARERAREGADLAGRREERVWTWRFQLLLAEAGLTGAPSSESGHILRETPPGGAEFSWVRARHALLGAQLALVTAREPADIERALRVLEHARETARRERAPDVEMDTERLMGQALERLGRSAEADEVLLAYLSKARAAGDDYREAVGRVNLGRSRLARQRYDEALSFLEPVLARGDSLPGLVFAAAGINAGAAYARLGHFERALELHQRVVAAEEQRGERIFLEQALGELGNTYVLRGDYEAAIPHLVRALDLGRESRSRDAPLWASTLASAYLELRRWDDAQRMNEEARTLGGRDAALPYLSLFDARILEGRGRLDEARRAYEYAADIGRDDPVIQWRTAWRLAAIAARQGRRADAHARFESALDTIERWWAEVGRQEYRVSVQDRLIGVYYDYVDMLVGEGQIERALVVADSGRARELAARQNASASAPARAAAVRRLAARLDAVLLFYWLDESDAHVWIVTGQRTRLVPIATSSTEIAQLAREYQAEIVDDLGDPRETSRSAGDGLYERLVAPIADAIPPGRRVIVVPDPAMGTLNLESLPVPGPPRHYWIEDVELAVAPSLGTLLDEAASMPRRADGDRSVLLIGDAVQADPDYPRLRFASAEIDAVARAFGSRATVLQGPDARPAAYRAAMPDAYSVVHFTAHAAANAVSPLDSAVILSPDPSGAYKLYARDVAEAPLAADLVTISACRSAGERAYSAEGLVGFAWAFLRAGARRVIAGLWDVDDRSTAELMRDLYARIADGASPSAALRDAKLAMIARRGAAARPYYWAPFQIFVGAAVLP